MHSIIILPVSLLFETNCCFAHNLICGCISFIHSLNIFIKNVNKHIRMPSFKVFKDITNSIVVSSIGQVGMTSLQVNCSLAEVNASVFIAVF